MSFKKVISFILMLSLFLSVFVVGTGATDVENTEDTSIINAADVVVPNYVVDANALSGTTDHTSGLSYALSADGQYVTYTQPANAAGDQYAYVTYPLGNVNVPESATGKYIMLKYRTTYKDNCIEIFAGANNGSQEAIGSVDNFRVEQKSDNTGALIADGKWHYVIMNIPEIFEDFGKPTNAFAPEDGTTDTYILDYLRIDFFNNASGDTANTFDLAYVVYAESIEQMVEYAGMDSYTYIDGYRSGVGVIYETVTVNAAGSGSYNSPTENSFSYYKTFFEEVFYNDDLSESDVCINPVSSISVSDTIQKNFRVLTSIDDLGARVEKLRVKGWFLTDGGVRKYVVRISDRQTPDNYKEYDVYNYFTEDYISGVVNDFAENNGFENYNHNAHYDIDIMLEKYLNMIVDVSLYAYTNFGDCVKVFELNYIDVADNVTISADQVFCRYCNSECEFVSPSAYYFHNYHVLEYNCNSCSKGNYVVGEHSFIFDEAETYCSMCSFNGPVECDRTNVYYIEDIAGVTNVHSVNYDCSICGNVTMLEKHDFVPIFETVVGKQNVCYNTTGECVCGAVNMINYSHSVTEGVCPECEYVFPAETETEIKTGSDTESGTESDVVPEFEYIHKFEKIIYNDDLSETNVVIKPRSSVVCADLIQENFISLSSIDDGDARVEKLRVQGWFLTNGGVRKYVVRICDTNTPETFKEYDVNNYYVGSYITSEVNEIATNSGFNDYDHNAHYNIDIMLEDFLGLRADVSLYAYTIYGECIKVFDLFSVDITNNVTTETESGGEIVSDTDTETETESEFVCAHDYKLIYDDFMLGGPLNCYVDFYECTVCGHERYESYPHTLVNGVCVVCEYVVDGFCAHDYKHLKFVYVGTADICAYDVSKCSKCNHEIRETISKHVIENGVCVVCEYVVDGFCAHDYKHLKFVYVGTADICAYDVSKCSKCNHEIRETISKHVIENGVCVVCEFESEHNYEFIKTETVEDDSKICSIRTYKCSNCGDTYKDEIEHNYEDGECTACGRQNFLGKVLGNFNVSGVAVVSLVCLVGFIVLLIGVFKLSRKRR